MNLEQVAAQCDKVKWSGQHSFSACCVGHKDRNPSMSVTEAEDGKILVHCHAGCPQDLLLDVLGLVKCREKTAFIPKSKPKLKPVPTTQSYALTIWKAATDTDPPFSFEAEDGHRVDTHPYAIKKRITHAFGARRGTASGKLIGKDADCIIVPNRDWENRLVGVECINADGVKQTFGSKGLLILGHPEGAQLIHVCEGWATAWAISQLFPEPFACVVAFGKSKLSAYAKKADVYFKGDVATHWDDKNNRDVWDLWEAGGGEQYARQLLRAGYV